MDDAVEQRENIELDLAVDRKLERAKWLDELLDGVDRETSYVLMPFGLPVGQEFW